jgi:hypothetical protein
MPVISMLFGVVIRIFYDDHNPPNFHAEYKGKKALFDFRGNIIRGEASYNQRRPRGWLGNGSICMRRNWLRIGN